MSLLWRTHPDNDTESGFPRGSIMQHLTGTRPPQPPGSPQRDGLCWQRLGSETGCWLEPRLSCTTHFTQHLFHLTLFTFCFTHFAFCSRLLPPVFVWCPENSAALLSRYVSTDKKLGCGQRTDCWFESSSAPSCSAASGR